MIHQTSSPDKLTMKRGRPTAEDIARIEQAILSTARGMFLADGFDGVGMEGVAAATGISRTTLYNRYPTKAALFRAVVEDSVALWYAGPRAGIAHDLTDIGDILRLRVADMAALLVDPLFRVFHSLTLSNRHRFPELGPIMHQLGYQDAVRLLVDDILAAGERDGVVARRPEVVAQLIINAIYGWFLQHDVVRELTVDDIATQGREMVDLLLSARDRW